MGPKIICNFASITRILVNLYTWVGQFITWKDTGIWGLGFRVVNGILFSPLRKQQHILKAYLDTPKHPLYGVRQPRHGGCTKHAQERSGGDGMRHLSEHGASQPDQVRGLLSKYIGCTVGVRRLGLCILNPKRYTHYLVLSCSNRKC